MHPLHSVILLGGAYLLTVGGRIYWPWLARRPFLVALGLAFVVELFAVGFLGAILKGK